MISRENKCDAPIPSEGGDTAFLNLGVPQVAPNTTCAPGGMETLSSFPEEDPLLGKIVDRYRIERLIGQGGMGIVYIATQLVPVRRTVAIKVARPGSGTGVLARFSAERQALAVMDHPNVAGILDAGTIDASRPYFVMNYVDGVPLTTYCDTKKIGIEGRLELFLQVCQGIIHAHQKGIIHRDLKPTNILVETVDGKPIPKIIDFGLAKAFKEEVGNRPDLTIAGEVMGTVSYMSPEQADWTSPDVDTRADVYSLGVILHELLTGSTPLNYDTLSKLSSIERLRRVQESKIERPSSFLSRLPEIQDVAAARCCTKPQLRSKVRGELDWVTMKALEKERERRYSSASALADDIRRYLNREPVSVGPPSLRYRATSFARRNRTVVAALTLVFFALVAGASVATWQAIRANAARRDAEMARQEAEEYANRVIEEKKQTEEARVAAEFAHQQAVQAMLHETAQREQAEQVTQLLEKIFQEANPRLGEQKNYDLRKVLVAQLKSTTEALSTRTDLEDGTRAKLCGVLGVTLYHLGDADASRKVLEKAVESLTRQFGAEDRNTLNARVNLASSNARCGKLNEAAIELRALLAIYDRTHAKDGEDFINVLNSLAHVYLMLGKYQEGSNIIERLYKIYDNRGNPLDPGRLSALNNLATFQQSLGKYAEASKNFDELYRLFTKSLGAQHPDTLVARYNYAATQFKMGNVKECLEHLKPLREVQIEKLGENHPETQRSTTLYALSLSSVGNRSESERLLVRVIKAQKEMLGPDHQDTLNAQNNLATLYNQMGRFGEATRLSQEVVNRRKRVLGTEHPHTLESLSNLAYAYSNSNRTRDAIQLYEEVAQAERRICSAAHPTLLTTLNNLASAYFAAGRKQEAAALFAEVIEKTEASSGVNLHDLDTTYVNLSMTYVALDQKEELLRTTIKLVKLRERLYGKAHLKTLGAMYDQALLLRALQRCEGRRSLCTDMVVNAEKILSNNPLEMAKIRAELAHCLTEEGESSRGADLYLKNLEVIRTTVNDAAICDASYAAGEALFRANRIPEAEPLLRESLALRKEFGDQGAGLGQNLVLIGHILVKRKDYREAIPYFTYGFFRLEGQRHQLPPGEFRQIVQACDGLVQVFDELGDTEKRDLWKSVGERYQPESAPAPRHVTSK